MSPTTQPATSTTSQPEPCARIREANLFDALCLTIKTLREAEARLSPTYCSCFRAGLESNLAAMRAGQNLEIVP
jgi:hypothetical protein